MMRRLIALSVVAVCVVGAAMAQEALPPPVETPVAEAAADAPVVRYPRWVRRPGASAFARNYPSNALSRGAPGAAVMCCTVLATGRLDCEVGFEWPAGLRFGEATLRVVRDFRVHPDDVAEFTGARLRHQIVWLAGPSTPELDDVLRRIREGTRNVCGPAIDWNERGPDDIVVSATPEVRPD